jgi:hypothetical protein
MTSLYHKDSIFLGMAMGIVLPAALYGLFHLSMYASGMFVTDSISEKMQLFLIAFNAVAMRFFMVNREKDRIGRGILLVTMLGALVHFTYYYTALLR